MRCKTSRFR